MNRKASLKYTLEDFKDSKYMKAEEKLKVLKQWKSFIESDFSRSRFTKQIYNHLNLHCSYIAHYDINGFYSIYFARAEDTILFIQQYDCEYGYRSTEYGDTRWYRGEEYSDINQAMCEIMELQKHRLYAKLKNTERDRDIAIAKALLAKHEVEISPTLSGFHIDPVVVEPISLFA